MARIGRSSKLSLFVNTKNVHILCMATSELVGLFGRFEPSHPTTIELHVNRHGSGQGCGSVVAHWTHDKRAL